MDARLPIGRNARQVQQGRRDQGRGDLGQERARAGAGHLGGRAYFVPLAKWIVSKAPGWQVWAVERRENLLEDQSEMNLAKEGKASNARLFDYYLGFLANPSVTHHMSRAYLSLAPAYAKDWGMNVAVGDLHDVIAAALKLGGKVVLGGHSLGGSVVTAYATWDFGGHAGADALAGLVYDDGGSGPAESTQDATRRVGEPKRSDRDRRG